MHIVKSRLKEILFCIAFLGIATPTYAVDGSGASQSSVDLSSQGLSEITNGSVHIFAAGSELSINAIKEVGNFTYITLKLVGESATTTIKLSTNILGHASLALGKTIEVTTTASGYLLQASGEVIAFIPNELGKSLIYSQKL